MGMVAGSSMLIILVSILFTRKQAYEISYVMHISLFILILIAVGVHRSDITLKALIIILVTASMWVSDRIIRFAKIT